MAKKKVIDKKLHYRANWNYLPLGEIVISRKGKRPILSPEASLDTIPYLDIKAIEKGIIENYADTNSSVQTKENDLLIVWDGARCGWVGKSIPGAIGSTLAALTPIFVDSSYLYHFLKLQFNYINNNSKGTGIPHVDPEILWNIKVPITSLEEQRAIVKKIEELLDKLYIANGLLQQIPKMIKNAKFKVLSSAISGRMSKEWRDNNFSETGSRIIMEGKHTIIKEELISAPAEWVKTRFKDVCEEITVGYVGPMAHEYKQSGIPFLRSQNVREFKYDPKDIKYISKTFHKQLKKSQLRPGDVLVVRSGTIVGISAVVPKSLKEANCSDLVIIRPSKVLDPHFATIYLNSQEVKKYVINNKVGIAQSHFNVGSVNNTPIGLPSLQEQRVITKQVFSLFRQLEIIEDKYLRLHNNFNSLPGKILDAAFSGNLLKSSSKITSHVPSIEEIKELKQQMLTQLSMEKVNKSKSNSMKQIKTPILSRIKKRFPNKGFIAKDLQREFESDYLSMQREFFSLIKERKIRMKFDESLQTIVFNLTNTK